MKNALTETAALFAATASAVRPNQLGDPTPCSEFTVADLITHLGGTLTDSERAARKLPRGEQTEQPEAEYDGASAVRAGERATAAWLESAAFDGTTEFGPGEMPASMAAAITVQELAFHSWDLARATGQSFALSDASAQTVFEIVEMIGERARANGAYGPELPVAAHASPFERALAITGRDVAWKA